MNVDLRRRADDWTESGVMSRAVAGLMLLACSAFPIALLALRARLGAGFGFRFLLWNLFLAWVPLGFALLAEMGWRRQWRKLAQWFALAAWLAFFPNAPYLVTDVIHLEGAQAGANATPLWFDALILFSMGLAGLVVGFVSLRIVQLVISASIGRAWGWIVSLGVLGLSGFGIYLGRFARYNSWDVLTQPRTLLYDVREVAFEPMSNQRTIGVSLLFTAFLVVSYLAMLSLGQVSIPARRVTAVDTADDTADDTAGDDQV